MNLSPIFVNFNVLFILAYKEVSFGVNVICIDWAKLADADMPVYKRAAENSMKVGKKVGKKIVKELLITKLNQDPKLIHAIGHSLGAHLVGHIGKQITNPKIGRITGR